MQTDRAARAQSALNDEIIEQAFTETLAQINKALLAAKTPEDREQRWQEYHGLKRAWSVLKKWPYEAETP